MTQFVKSAAAILIAILLFSICSANEIHSNIGIENRAFIDGDVAGHKFSTAIRGQVDYTKEPFESQSIDIDVDFLFDDLDHSRRYINIAELRWSFFPANSWEYRVGYNTVFWGVVESVNIVDVINPRIIVDDPEGDSKFGQLMANARYMNGDQTLDIYVLPGFREVEYSDANQLLSPLLPISEESAIFESSRENNRVDFAARYATLINDFDIAISYFNGNSREPVFQSALVPGGVDGMRLGLVPHYYLIEQAGLEFQYLHGNTAYKLEVISRHENHERYSAAVTGLEYTQTGIFGSVVDVGWVGEYLFDDRGDDAVPFTEHDYLFASRINFNDADRTTALIKVLYDPRSDEAIWGFETSFDLMPDLKLSIDSQFFIAEDKPRETFYEALTLLSDSGNKISQFRKHDYLQLKIQYYF